ncbi:MAG: hypothetical protein KAI29_15120, partial [Cyclobacteriaceae bacterium]|nr:hypothetical protein [Cyclobacteriaceae bacterium]
TPVLKFTNTSENAGRFLWDFGDGNVSEEFEPTHQYESSDSLQSFNIILTAGESFCSNVLSLHTTSVKTFVPNFISPNGDGKNDVFEITVADEIELYI